MTEEEVKQIFIESEAIITGGHFVYTSGRHGDSYVNKDNIYRDPRKLSILARALAEHFSNSKIEVVVAPAYGGIALSQWVAYHLSEITKRTVYACFSEKETKQVIIETNTCKNVLLYETGDLILRRGFGELVHDKKKGILVVDDVVTTGSSIRKTIFALWANRSGEEAVGVLCNRGGVGRSDLLNTYEFYSLFNLSLPSWDSKECPLCKNNISINRDLGKGR